MSAHDREIIMLLGKVGKLKLECDRLRKINSDLLAAHKLIFAYKGMTLLGGGRYDEGAATAFNTVAEISEDAIAKAELDAEEKR